MDDRQEAQVQHGREIQQVARLDPGAVPLGKEQRHDLRILFADLRRQFGQHAGGHAQVDADVENVPHPHPATGDDEHLVLFRQLADLLHEGNDHLLAEVYDAMAADLDYVEVGHQLQPFDGFVSSHQRFTDQGLSLELVVDFTPFRHCSTFLFRNGQQDSEIVQDLPSRSPLTGLRPPSPSMERV